MAGPLYIEVLLICVIICVILLMILRSEASYDVDSSLLANLMVHIVVLNLLDCLCVAATYTHSALLALFSNSSYFMVGIMLSFSWFLYADKVLNVRLWQKRWFKIILLLPFVLETLAIIASFWTGWLFLIDDMDNYQRGPYFLVQMCVCGLYIFIPFCVTFCRVFRKKFYSSKHQNMALSSFAVFPFVMMLVQIFYAQTPSIAIGLTLAILLIFLDIQSRLITIDPLTGLNNRNRLIRFLDAKVSKVRDDRQLFLFMLDIDKFKSINDNYGRLEADIVLQMVADTLMSVCGHLGHFIARFRSDEFVVVAEMKDFPDALYLRRNINLFLSKKCEHLKFPLRLSIGYTAWNASHDSIPDFLVRAEKQLQADKKSKAV